MTFQGLVESITFAGHVTAVDDNGPSFKLQCRSGDTIEVYVGPSDHHETDYQVLENVDGVDRDRTVVPSDGQQPADPVVNLRRYVTEDALVFVRGVHQQVGDRERFEAHTVYLLKSKPDDPHYVFEDPYWWLNQTALLANRWLDELFGIVKLFENACGAVDVSWFGSKCSGLLCLSCRCSGCDLIPDRQAGGHLGSPLGCTHQMTTGPKMLPDVAESKQEPLSLPR
jgi:hypothetical protein